MVPWVDSKEELLVTGPVEEYRRRLLCAWVCGADMLHHRIPNRLGVLFSCVLSDKKCGTDIWRSQRYEVPTDSSIDHVGQLGSQVGDCIVEVIVW